MQHGRLPWPRPDELTPEQREFYDKVVTSPRANATRPTPLTDEEGRFNGPFNAMLTNPGLGDALQAVGIALRFSGKLPRSIFEAVVLMVAVERHAPYEWYAHAPIALREGLEQATLDALLQRDDDKLSQWVNADVIQLVRDTMSHVQPAEPTVRAVQAEYGADGVTEIVITVAFYDAIATLIRTWDSPLPEGVPNPLA